MNRSRESSTIVKFVQQNDELFRYVPTISIFHNDVFTQFSEHYKFVSEHITYTKKTDFVVSKDITSQCENLPSVLFAYKKFYSTVPSDKLVSQIEQLQHTDEFKQETMQFFQHKLDNFFERIRRISHTDNELLTIVRFWDKFDFFYDYFIPLDVQYSFEQNQIHYFEFLSEIEHSEQKYTCVLKIYTNSENLKITFLNDIFARIFSLCMLYNSSCKHTEFIIYFSNSTKNIIINQHIDKCWTPLNINTGCTFRDSCRPITIWRKQEAMKTFIHEMIHCFHWDIQTNVSFVNAEISQMFRFLNSSNVKLYEAYTETWATLLNVYICSHISQINVLELLNIELKFLMFQVAKIFKISGFSTFTEFKNKMSNTSFCQTTDVFSYFVIKSTLLWDMNWFVQHIRQVPFVQNSGSVHQLWEHSKTILLSNEYSQCIDYIMTHHNFNESLFINRTMRMTAIEYY